METTKAEKIRLGIFLLLCVSLVIGIVGFYLGKRLTNEKVLYFTRFAESVDGLVPGANVKWNGVIVGKVLRLYIDDANLQEVVVQFEVEKGTPIKASVLANLIGGFSITGLKTIELTGGNPKEPLLAENHEVTAGTSQMKQISGQAEALVLKMEILMNNFLAITGDENQANIAHSLRNLNSITSQLDKAQIGAAMLGVEHATTSMDVLSKRANSILARSEDDLAQTVIHMKEASENLDDFSRKIKANPTVLLQNEDKPGRSK